MSLIYHIKQIGGQAEIYTINSDTGQQSTIGYFDRTQLQPVYNSLANTLSIVIEGNSPVNIPDINPGGILFIETVLNGSVEITDQDGFNTEWAVLFPNEGGGSGTTPDLQQVCDVNFVTNTNIIIEQDGTQSKFIVYGKAGTDDRRAALASDSLEDSGFLELENKNSANAKIFNTNGSVDERFEMPDLGGAGGTIYTKEQLPNGADSVLYTDAAGELVTGNGIRYSQVNENFLIQRSNGTDGALQIDLDARIYSIGDIGAVNNGTRIIINDNTPKISLIGQLNADVVGEFANNAAALLGGLVAGDIYQTTVGGDAFLKRVI